MPSRRLSKASTLILFDTVVHYLWQDDVPMLLQGWRPLGKGMSGA